MIRIIIAPAKKMKEEDDTLECEGLPVFIDDADKLRRWLKSKSFDELKALWRCNDKIVNENIDRLKSMDLHRRLTPAVLCYDGIAFQYMVPTVFENGQFAYIQEHMRILSGFYGVLKPIRPEIDKVLKRMEDTANMCPDSEFLVAII